MWMLMRAMASGRWPPLAPTKNNLKDINRRRNISQFAKTATTVIQIVNLYFHVFNKRFILQATTCTFMSSTRGSFSKQQLVLSCLQQEVHSPSNNLYFHVFNKRFILQATTCTFMSSTRGSFSKQQLVLSCLQQEVHSPSNNLYFHVFNKRFILQATTCTFMSSTRGSFSKQQLQN